MSKCSNCGSTITCGCQKRKLADGKMGCTKCAAQVTSAKTSDKPTNIKNNNITVNVTP